VSTDDPTYVGDLPGDDDSFGAKAFEPVATERAGDQIGPYKLLELLGEGGFGTVWLAERREPFVQRVALKLIKAGMDSKAVIARFRQERQAMAAMSHPNIAKVYDGGLTPAGRPYFAMEYVKGEPITTFCDRAKLGIEDRLRLFEQACEAILHAHLKSIVHRDITPRNILAYQVEGEGPKLKVIDFGLAKAMGAGIGEQSVHTGTNRIVGTPAYMSPEQADPSSSDIDSRTDVYSLGVLLYELLAGAPPFDPDEIKIDTIRLLAEKDPPSPSDRLSGIASKDQESTSRIERSRGVRTAELVRRLRGELEWIPLKAMRKERQHRYQTALELVNDVRAYLDGRPLQAGPESASYRVRKYVRRNRALVAGVGAVAAALVVGVGLATWQWREAVAAKDAALASEAKARESEATATERAEQLKKVSDFQAGMLGSIDTKAAGEGLMTDVRERFAAALEKAGVPEVDREAQTATLGDLLTRVNATDTAAAMIDRTILKPAIKTIDDSFKDDPATDASLRQALADLYRTVGLYDAAFPLQESALATRRRRLGEEHPNTLSSINNMGRLLQAQGKLAEAEPYYREALEKRRRTLGEEHPSTLTSIGNMGFLLQAQGKLAEAEPYCREALEKRRRTLGEEHPDTLTSISSMGFLLQAQGKLAEAEPYCREALEKYRRTRGEEHPNTLNSITNMGGLLQARGKLAEAEPYLREALEKSRRTLGEEHPSTLNSIGNMGFLLKAQGKLAEAEPYYREALEKRRRTLGEEHPNTLNSTNNMGSLLRAQGKLAEAEPYWREALEKRRRTLGEEHPDTLRSVNNMGARHLRSAAARSARSTRTRSAPSTTWASCSRPRASSPRRSRTAARRSRSAAARSARSTRTRFNPSTTWATCSRPRANSPRRSRTCARRSRRAAARSARSTRTRSSPSTTWAACSIPKASSPRRSRTSARRLRRAAARSARSTRARSRARRRSSTCTRPGTSPSPARATTRRPRSGERSCQPPPRPDRSTLHRNQPRHAALRHPFGDQDAAIGKPDRIVRVHESAELKTLGRLSAQVRGVTIAKRDHGLEGLVVETDDAFKVRHQHQVLAELHVARHAHAVGVNRHRRAIERKHLDASVAAVGDDQHRLLAARIDAQPVRAARLALARAGLGDDLLPLAVSTEEMDEALAVAVAHEEVATRMERDIRRAPLRSRAVHAALHRAGRGPYHGAIERGLHHAAPARVAVIEELLVAFLAQVKTMRAAGEVRAPTADRAPVGLVHADSQRLLAPAADGVRQIDPPRCILRHAVRVAPRGARERREERVIDRVALRARADGRRQRIVTECARSEKRRSRDGGRGGSDERASVDGHVRRLPVRRAHSPGKSHCTPGR